MLKEFWKSNASAWLRETDWRAVRPYVGVIVAGLILALALRNSGSTPAVESGDDRLADYTFWLMLFTAALSIVSVLQLWILTRADQTTRTAAEAARDTAEATIAAQRPWLKFELELSGPLSGGKDGLFLPVRFKVQNVGNNPATDVQYVVALVCGASGISISDAVRKLSPMSNYPGAVVFPNDPSQGALTAGILSSDEVKSAMVSVTGNNQIAFGGVACVRYRYAGGIREGETIRAFLLCGKGGVFEAFDFSKLPIPMDSLILDKNTFYETVT